MTRSLQFWVSTETLVCNLANAEPTLDMDAPEIDILPLRAGHTLVIPKTHISRVSELPAEIAAAVGEAVSKVAHSLTEGQCQWACE
jgi:hypothetical protein